MLVLLTLLSLAMPLISSDEAQIRTTLRDFVKGADLRNTDQLQRALHPDARQYVQMPNGLVAITTEAFLGMIDAEQIGGEDRTLHVHDLRIRGNTAFADITITGGAFTFADYVTLMRVNERWQIMSAVITLVEGDES
ncbi:MAG: hypothetical protein RhofKO_37600 [Rhodothermales bacterium]